MKYHIKREMATDPEKYRYFVEDENGRYIDGIMYVCPIDAPSTDDFAADYIICKLKAKINSEPRTIKTIEL